MLTALVTAAEETHELAPLVLPLWAFPLIAAVFFAIAGLVTFSYRDVANRHSHKPDPAGDEHGHGAHH